MYVLWGTNTFLNNEYKQLESWVHSSTVLPLAKGAQANLWKLLFACVLCVWSCCPFDCVSVCLILWLRDNFWKLFVVVGCKSYITLVISCKWSAFSRCFSKTLSSSGKHLAENPEKKKSRNRRLKCNLLITKILRAVNVCISPSESYRRGMIRKKLRRELLKNSKIIQQMNKWMRPKNE